MFLLEHNALSLLAVGLYLGALTIMLLLPLFESILYVERKTSMKDTPIALCSRIQYYSTNQLLLVLLISRRYCTNSLEDFICRH